MEKHHPLFLFPTFIFKYAAKSILLTAFIFSSNALVAQLSGTKNIPGDYPTLAAAITDLNAVGVGAGGVTINLIAGNPQTAPIGGYVIGGAGSIVLSTASASNPIIFQGNSNTITAFAGQTSGFLNDAVIKIVGADWITITGFTLLENGANTTTAAATNNMTEWGIAILYVSTIDNGQNITIQNNTIDLSRTYQNTFGIYANATHSATAPTTSATATGSTGGNHNLKIYANTIQDVNLGIVVVGPTAAADNNDIVEVGTSQINSNTVQNFGTTGTFSGYANVSGTVNGILVRNSKNFNVSYNVVTSSNGGTTAGTLNGIQIPSFSNAPIGTFTNSVSNNTLSLKSGSVSGAINGINIGSTSASTTSTINVNGNDFNNFGYTVASAGVITFITQGGTHLNQNINNNTFTNMSVSTTGSVTFISNSTTLPSASGIKNVNENAIMTGFTKTGAGGTITFFTDNGSDPAGSINNLNDNIFSNITITGSTVILAFANTNGGNPVKNVNNNIVSNISGGTTATITGFSINFDGGTTTVSGNSVDNITNGGQIIGFAFGSSNFGTTNAFQNAVHTLVGTGTGAISAFSVTGTSSGGTRNIFQNKIYNIENSNAAGSANGMLVTGSSAINIYNNFIGDIRTPAVSATNPLNGINITATTSSSVINVSYNTIYLNASSTGTNFGSSGIFHTASATATSGTLNLRNNIIVNLSTPNGTGLTVAYRRSSATLTNYGSVSDYNLFYTGTPGSTNLIFYDGTNSDQTLAAYKSRVAPRDAASVTELPGFLSTSGSNVNFLHINNTIPTQTESGGINISGITDDFDDNIRQGNGGYSGTGTAPDIGADEFEGISADFILPVIFYTLLNNTGCTADRMLSATINDASDINITSGTKPRLYFKKSVDDNTFAGNTSSDNGWKFVEASNTSSPFQFTTDFSLLQSVLVTGDVIQYFVVAQDLATPANVGINSGTFATTPATVALDASNFPITGTINSFNFVAGLSDMVTIGMSGDYPSLTGATTGLFHHINTNGLVGNLTVLILDVSVSETGAVALNPVNVTSCDPGPYTITIQPNEGVSSILSGSTAGTTPLIDLNGADNISIDGLNTGGSSLTISNLSTTAPSMRLVGDASNNSLTNITIEGAVTSTSSGVVMLSTGIVTGNDNNTITNCTIKNAATIPVNLFYSNGSPAFPNSGNTLMGNTFKNFSGTGIIITGTGSSNGNENWTVAENLIFQEAGRTTSLTGISFSSLGTNDISKNIVRDLITSLSVTGILLNDARNTTVTGNKIYNIPSTSGATSSLTGIQFSGNSGTSPVVTIHNNMISIVPSFTNNQQIRGIYDFGFGGNTFNAYYNSVYIGGASGGTNASWGLVRGILAPTNFTASNNILLNDRTGGGANHFGAGDQSANAGTFISNYNIFIGTGVTAANFMDYGTSSSGVPVSVSAWKSGPPARDANSQFSNPTGAYTLTSIYQSATDLHAVAANNPASDMGTPVSVTVDFDNETRDASTPDIGADEFVAVIGLDVGIVGLVTPILTGCFTGTESVTVTLKNFSPGPLDLSINNVTIYVTTTGGYNSNIVLNSGILAGNGTQNVTVQATIDMTGNGTYTFNSNALVSGDINNANNAMEAVIITVSSLGGTYNVGAGEEMSGGFNTLTDAVAAYNGATCLSGPVTFALVDSDYSTNEIFPIGIQANAQAGSTKTLTIKPSQTTTITGSNSTAIIILNGADYVTIDGSISNTGNAVCPPSNALRDLTIVNTNTGTFSAVVWLQSTGTNGATNNKVINTNITGNSNTTTLFGLGSGSATIGTSSTGTDNDNNSFINNNISKVVNGIYSKGASAANKNSGTIINQNQISAVSPNNVGRTGIWIGFEDNITISGNSIGNISSTSDVFGISLGLSNSFSNSSTSGSEVTNAIVVNNILHGIICSGTNSAAGIMVASAGSGITTLANNMISGVSANGTFSDFAAAILLGGGTGSATRLYYNTIHMNGAVQGATAGSSQSFGVAVTTSTAPVVDFRNNIIVNTQLPNTSGTTKFYALGFAYSSTTGNYTGLTSDNNDLFVSSGANYFVGITGGLSSGTTRTALLDWQNETGRDGASQSLNPGFTSSSDLHLDIGDAGNTLLDGTASVLSITNDIDCDARHEVTPDIGADEVTIVSCTGAIGGTASGSSSFCGSGTPTITGSGYSVGTGSTHQWQSSADLAFTNPIDIAGQTNPATLTTGVVTSTTYFRLKVTCSSGNALDYSTIVTITINPLPAANASNSSPVCEGTSFNLTGSTDIGVTFLWTGPNGFTSTVQNPVIAMSSTSSAGVYTFMTTSSSGCTSLPATTNVTINLIPSAVIITPAAVSMCSGDAATLLTASAILHSSVTVQSGAVSLAIPDVNPAGVTSSVNINGIPAGAIIDSIVVTVNITHTWNEDLDIFLTAPNSNMEELSTDNGDDSDHYTNTRLSSDGAKPSITLGNGPFAGTYKAEGTLSNLFSNPNGNWILKVADDEEFVTGTLNNWALKVYYTAGSDLTWSVSPGDYTGLYLDANATMPYTGSVSSSVYTLPTSTKTYTATATSSGGCTNTGTVEVYVNSLLVENNNNVGGGSLRDVIGCASPGSTITFAPALLGQIITLTSGEIVINKNLTIAGPGSMDLSISGNNASRIFHVNAGNTFNIENIILTNAASVTEGGAFWNEGIMTLKDVIINGSTQNGLPKGFTGAPSSVTEFLGNTFIND